MTPSPSSMVDLLDWLKSLEACVRYGTKLNESDMPKIEAMRAVLSPIAAQEVDLGAELLRLAQAWVDAAAGYGRGSVAAMQEQVNFGAYIAALRATPASSEQNTRESDLARLARPPAPNGDGTTVGAQPVARHFQYWCEIEDVPSDWPYSSNLPVPRGHWADWNAVMHLGGKDGPLEAHRSDWVIRDVNGDFSVMTDEAYRAVRTDTGEK